jgi:hypothetical protein
LVSFTAQLSWLARQEYSKAERLDLAKRSRAEPPMFGSAERQRLTRELHERLLAREAVRNPTPNVSPTLTFTPALPANLAQSPSA